MRKGYWVWLLLLASPAGALRVCPVVTPPNIRQFAQGCYTGNGNDARNIVSGILNPGVLMIFDANVGTANNAVFTIPDMGVNNACQLHGAMSGTACGAGIIENVIPGSFQIGSDSRVNTNLRPFCWFEWGLNANDHGTFQYIGNGTSPRTITVTGTPDAAIVQTDISFSQGREPYMRTKDMAANTSYGWYNVGESPHTQIIRNFVANGIVVGSEANVNGAIYNGWWWAAHEADYGAAMTWTGNGSSNVGCAAAADKQTLTAPCPVQQVITSGCTITGCNGATGTNCPPTAPVIRGTNMGSSVLGPGNTGTDNFRSLWFGGYFEEVLGDIFPLVPSYTVAGASSHGLNLNNANQTYYSWITCSIVGNGPGTVALQNWCFAGNTVACWEMEEASNSDRTNNNCNSSSMSGGTTLCGFSTCACDLSAANTVAQDTTNKVVGSASALFTGSNDLTSPFANSGTKFNLAGSTTWGGYLYTTVDTSGIALRFAGNSGSQAYTLSRDFTSKGVTCSVVDGGNTTHTATGGSFPVNTWVHAICVFDGTGHTLTTYVDGNSVATTAVNTMRSVSGTGLEIGVNSWIGNIDESFVYSGVINATDVCRVASCGLNGSLCSCYSGDQTVYIDNGRNGTAGGGCALPACNKVGPS